MAKIGLWQIFQLWIFVFSREKNSTTKATEYVFFCFFFSVSWFSSLSSKSLNITVCKTVKASPLFHQADRLARNASDVSAADWRYQTQVKKYDIFLSVLLRLFSGLEILL